MNLSGIATSLLLTALVLLWVAVRSWKRGSRATAGMTTLLGLLTALVGGVAMGLAAGFTAMDLLSDESPVGTIEFSALDTNAYMARLTLEDRDPAHYRIAGDHWQLDVRFLKWELPATLMGAEKLFQLDRLSGRYADISSLTTAEVTAYGLSTDPGRWMWSLTTRAERWIPWLDAVYGSAVFLPMADGARFRISVADAGLVARPDNSEARAATTSW